MLIYCIRSLQTLTINNSSSSSRSFYSNSSPCYLARTAATHQSCQYFPTTWLSRSSSLTKVVCCSPPSHLCLRWHQPIPFLWSQQQRPPCNLDCTSNPEMCNQCLQQLVKRISNSLINWWWAAHKLLANKRTALSQQASLAVMPMSSTRPPDCSTKPRLS